MRSDIVRREGELNRRLPRAVARSLDAVEYHALEAAARIRAGAYVTHLGATLVTQLSREEEELIKAAPLAEPRLKEIIDSFALLVRAEIYGLA